MTRRFTFTYRTPLPLKSFIYFFSNLCVSWCLQQAEEEHTQALKHGSIDAKPPDFETVQDTILRKDVPAPSIEDVKDFMRFVWASSEGLISDKASARSLRAYAENFYRAFQVKTGTKIEHAHKKEVYYVRVPYPYPFYTLNSDDCVVDLALPPIHRRDRETIEAKV